MVNVEMDSLVQQAGLCQGCSSEMKVHTVHLYNHSKNDSQLA